MRNTWTRCKYGHSHQSAKESRRCEELHLWQKAGLISNLVRGTRYRLEVNGIHICDYVCDFVYDVQSGHIVREDVKGRKSGPAYEKFRIKKKLMLGCLGMEILET